MFNIICRRWFHFTSTLVLQLTYIFRCICRHPVQFYDVHRYDLRVGARILLDTECRQCHCWNLVEGEQVLFEEVGSHQALVKFGESWVVPAATGQYVVTNDSGSDAVLLKVFVKSDRCAKDCDDVEMAKKTNNK